MLEPISGLGLRISRRLQCPRGTSVGACSVRGGHELAPDGRRDEPLGISVNLHLVPGLLRKFATEFIPVGGNGRSSVCKCVCGVYGTLDFTVSASIQLTGSITVKKP